MSTNANTQVREQNKPICTLIQFQGAIIYRLKKASKSSILSLTQFPKVFYKTVPMLVWLRPSFSSLQGGIYTHSVMPICAQPHF